MLDVSPLISVIIPTFNRATFLPDALASIYRQKQAPLQVIVVDDGSTDHTRQVMRGFAGKLQYIYQTNQGPAAARNTGLAYAQGEWITFLDSDDVWVADRLPRQLTLAQAYPNAGMIWGMMQSVHLPHSNCDLAKSQSAKSQSAKSQFELHGAPALRTNFESALIKRVLFTDGQVGSLNEALWIGEDADWFCRLLEQPIEIVIHPEVVAINHWHEGNLVTNQVDSHAKKSHGLLLALAHSLRRRQQAAHHFSVPMKCKIHWALNKESAA